MPHVHVIIGFSGILVMLVLGVRDTWVTGAHQLASLAESMFKERQGLNNIRWRAAEEYS